MLHRQIVMAKEMGLPLARHAATALWTLPVDVVSGAVFAARWFGGRHACMLCAFDQVVCMLALAVFADGDALGEAG